MSGSRIVRGMEEAARWSAGEGTMRVTLPGQEPREMTAEEVAAAAAARQQPALPDEHAAGETRE